jgi:hypothetical protein
VIWISTNEVEISMISTSRPIIFSPVPASASKPASDTATCGAMPNVLGNVI